MLTLAKMLEILNEKDAEKRNQMIAELSEKDRERLLKEAQKVHKEDK